MVVRVRKMVQNSRSKQRLCLLIFLLGIMVILTLNFLSGPGHMKKRTWKSKVRPNFSRPEGFLSWGSDSGSVIQPPRSTISGKFNETTGFSIPNNGDPDFYGVMFDAGSTGSRVHVFHFVSSEDQPPKLVAELYNYTKIGLSHFAKKPEEGAASLKPLLDAALDFIPAEKWSSSPVALKATAGLRLLPKEEADALLEAVYQLFSDSALHVEAPEQSISILEGNMEGVYIWFTLNFLLGGLSSHDKSVATVGALDLGGGSTQITFEPTSSVTLQEGRKRDFIEEFRFLHKKFKLYTHSYLGLGLKEARLQIMKIGHIIVTTDGSRKEKENLFYTPCLPPNATESWEFGGTTYTAQSVHTDLTAVYDSCLSLTKKYLQQMDVHSPSEIHNKDFYAMSYFWSRAGEVHLVDEHVGGSATVGEIVTTTQKVCRDKELKSFLCMDMVFISTLLTKGYGFSENVNLHVCPKIGKFEVSWALGATIDLLHTHWDHL